MDRTPNSVRSLSYNMVSKCRSIFIAHLQMNNNLQYPLWTSHILILLSWLPVMTLLESGLKRAAKTLPVWPVSVC